MYAEVSTMHMLGICADWCKDETASLLWSAEDKKSVYNWCRETRGRLPNLDKQTSGGGQIFKLVQVNEPRPASHLSLAHARGPAVRSLTAQILL